MSANAATGIILGIIAALPTPELRAGAFLAVLTHRVSSSLDHGATTVHCDNLLMHVQQRGHGNR